MDATDLSDLLGNAPSQQPAFAPMVTGGGDPFISPINTMSTKPAPDYSGQVSILRYSIKGLLSYFSYFLTMLFEKHIVFRIFQYHITWLRQPHPISNNLHSFF